MASDHDGCVGRVGSGGTGHDDFVFPGEWGVDEDLLLRIDSVHGVVGFIVSEPDREKG
jgi:hypothetical protein